MRGKHGREGAIPILFVCLFSTSNIQPNGMNEMSDIPRDMKAVASLSSVAQDRDTRKSDLNLKCIPQLSLSPTLLPLALHFLQPLYCRC